jgi:hypothetical protein
MSQGVDARCHGKQKLVFMCSENWLSRGMKYLVEPNKDVKGNGNCM